MSANASGVPRRAYELLEPDFLSVIASSEGQGYLTTEEGQHRVLELVPEERGSKPTLFVVAPVLSHHCTAFLVCMYACFQKDLRTTIAARWSPIQDESGEQQWAALKQEVGKAMQSTKPKSYGVRGFAVVLSLYVYEGAG